MPMREAKAVEPKAERARHAAELTVAAPEAQYQHAPDIASGMAAQTNSVQRAAMHAALVRRARAAGPAPTGRALLQLQREYGNRHAQGVVELARQAEDEAEATPEVEQAIQRARGGGQPLDDDTRGRMEGAFGADFGGVRIHTGSQADALNRAVSARAFATGGDIFFRDGEYNPGSSAGRHLLAHELTHVVQQDGSEVRPKLTIGAVGDVHEQEADRVADQVSRTIDVGAPARDMNGDVDDERVRRAPLGGKRVLTSIQRQATLIPAAFRDRVAGWLRDMPGWELLTVILGRDPITDQPVERTASNVIQGVLSLVPGGAERWENLQRSGAVERAFAWFNQQFTRLNLTLESMVELVQQAAHIVLSPAAFLSPIDTVRRVKALFEQPLVRMRNFAVAAGQKVLEFIFEGVLGGQGGVGQRVLGILRRAGGAFSAIIGDPVGFGRNLIQAVGGGLERFADRIGEHLRTGIAGWLLGALQGALRLPDRLDLAGIVSIVVQFLGLTYDRLRGLLVRRLGEEQVRYLEQAFEFLRLIATRGLAAAWEQIAEFAGNLMETVMGGIREWVSRSVVVAAIRWILSLFNPAGAVLQAIMAIYNTIQFFVERAQQIAALAESVYESIGSIAAGNVGAAINHVEQTMGRALPVVLSFLARIAGLGNIANEIRAIVQRVRAPITNAINRLAEWIADRVRGLLGRRETAQPAAGAAPAPAGAPTDVTPAWQRGVEGVGRALADLEAREADEATIRAQLPVWQRAYGFTSLTLENTDEQWLISGRMNPSGAVARQPKVTQPAIKAAAGYDMLTFTWDEMGAQVDRRFTVSENRRRTRVQGHLEDIRPTGEERTGNTRVATLPGWEVGDVAGHLIGHQFYGMNYDRDNFVPMEARVNHPQYYTLFESKMATWMRAQKKNHRAWLVEINIRAFYDDALVGRQRMRPVSFSFSAVGITGHRAASGAVVLKRENLARGSLPNPRP